MSVIFVYLLGAAATSIFYSYIEEDMPVEHRSTTLGYFGVGLLWFLVLAFMLGIWAEDD